MRFRGPGSAGRSQPFDSGGGFRTKRTSLVVLLPLLAGAIALGVNPALASTAEQEAKLLPADGETDNHFGSSVALDGDTVIIGAYRDDDNGPLSGSAYVFTRTAGVWSEQAKLLPSDGADGDEFGWSVALDGDTAVIGARGDDDHGVWTGSVYVFTRMGSSWTERAKLLAPEGVADDTFGESVALDGDTAVIGAPGDNDTAEHSGAAYVFTRAGGAWAVQAKLRSADGVVRDFFGGSVAVDDDTAVIGATGDDDNGQGAGSAYVFARVEGVWAERAKLLASDGAAGDLFAKSVALDSDTAVIGAPWNDAIGNTLGAAYVFTRTGDGWTEQAKLLADERTFGNRLGWSVAIDGDTAIVGASNDDHHGESSGSAYVYTRSGEVWTTWAKVVPADGAADDRFGWSVTLKGETAVIGALGDDDNGIDAGSAYAFLLSGVAVPATSVIGLTVLLAAMLGAGVYRLRRRRTGYG